MAGKEKSIRKACQLTDKIFEEILKRVGECKTESDLDKLIRRLIRQRGLKISFSPIVAAGKNAAFPHHKAKKSKLTGLVVIDFGVKVNKYCSDMTRMIYVGNPTNRELKLYDTLLKVQKQAVRDLKVGKLYCEIDKKARNDLGLYKKYFIHTLGHGVGKKIHEKPIIASVSNKKKIPKRKIKLVKEINSVRVKIGDIITIEPGIYIKNRLGIRIEDTILIKKNGIEILTKSSKKLFTF